MAITFLDEPKSKITYLDEEKSPVQESVKKQTLDSRIEARGGFVSPITNPIQSFNEFRRKMSTGSGLQKTGAALEAIGMPITQTVSAVSAPITEGIRQAMPNSGGFNPQKIGQEFVAGLTGKKQYQAGDMYRAANIPEPIAATLGFANEMAIPLNIIKAGYGLLPAKVMKAGDKGLMVAGEKILQGTEEAKKIIGGKLNDVYKLVNDFQVNGANISKVVLGVADDVPAPIIKEIENQLGKKLTDIRTIEEFRALKSAIGSFKAGSFGKKMAGVNETLDSVKIDRAYKTVATAIRETVEQGAGKEYAQKLHDADTAFKNISNASDYLRKMTVDKTLKMPTKAGMVAKSITDPSNISARTALETVKSAGGKAKSEISKAIKSMDWFNKKMAMARTAEKAAGAAILGGMFGAIGGKTLQKVSGGTE
jgi:hypothetical protein